MPDLNNRWILESRGSDFEVWKLRVDDPAGWFVKLVNVLEMEWEKGAPGPDAETAQKFEFDPTFVPDSK